MTDMLSVMQIVAVLIVSVLMATSLAHALELPGKRRLPREHYFAVQRIYYPGFTIAGASEPLSLISLVLLLFLLAPGSADFLLTLAALIGIIAMVVIYWALIHPINKMWLKGASLDTLGSGFFAVGGARAQAASGADEWMKLRDRWEYSHLIRAVLAESSFIVLVIASSS
jgi:hypothetical protein